MDLPYYIAPAIASRPPESFTQYYPNTTIPMNMVRQFQQNQGMLRPPFQDMFYPPAPDPKHYMPRYSMVAPNVYPAYAQPPMLYPGLTMPMSHMPNMIYPNPALPSPTAEPALSYVSMLKSEADRIAASDALVKRDSATLSKPQTNSNSLTEVIVIPDDTEATDRETRTGYEHPFAADPSLGQKSVFGDAYQPGPGQIYISKIRSIVEGKPFDDPRFYTTYPKRPRKEANSANQLPDSQEVPPVEGKKRRNSTKNPSNGSKAKKPRSTSKSPTHLPPTHLPPTHLPPTHLPPIHLPPTHLPPANQHLTSQQYDLAYFSTYDQSDRYPRPVSSNCQFLYIGSNGTIVPTSLYATIKWESAEKSARILMEFIFNGILPTHSLDEDYTLDPNIQDVVTIVARKCFLHEQAVRIVIRNICADASLKAFPMRA